MPLTLADLSALDQDDVQAQLDTIAQLVQEAHPNATLRRGAFHDLVLLLSAILSTNDQALVDRAIQSLSLLKINEDPTLADDDIVDAVLSNYRLTRRPGAQATGNIQIILNEPASFGIVNGHQFLANGVIFITDQAYAARLLPAEILEPADKLVEPLGNGKFGFIIGALAFEEGTSGNVTRGTQMITQAPLHPFYNSAAAYTDFTGGRAEETNAELMDRLAQGAGLKATSNRPTNEALLTENFPSIVGLSQIGFGDPEMFRDQHTIWPGSHGGRVDMYTRTQELVGSFQLTKTATLVSKVGPVGTWQFSLGRDDVPGFYEIEKITQVGDLNLIAGGYAVVVDERNIDLSGGGFIPDIENTLEGTYSRYQTSTIRFVDTDTDATTLVVGVATRQYDVAVLGLDILDEVQDFLNLRDEQWPAGDALVKAPVPCYVTMTITIQVLATQPEPDVDAIKEAATSAVNTSEFPGVLAAALIAGAVNPLLGGGVMTEVDMDGRIRRPDGVNIFLASTSALIVPDDPVNYVTGRTVGFFTKPDDINVTVIVV